PEKMARNPLKWVRQVLQYADCIRATSPPERSQKSLVVLSELLARSPGHGPTVRRPHSLRVGRLFFCAKTATGLGEIPPAGEPTSLSIALREDAERRVLRSHA